MTGGRRYAVEYGVIYTVGDAELIVLALRVPHRSKVYRDL